MRQPIAGADWPANLAKNWVVGSVRNPQKIRGRANEEYIPCQFMACTYTYTHAHKHEHSYSYTNHIKKERKRTVVQRCSFVTAGPAPAAKNTPQTPW